MKDERETTISWKTCMRVALTIIVLLLLARYWEGVEGFVGALFGGLAAMFVGFVVAYILNIPLRFFEGLLPGEHGDGTMNRTLSLLVTVLCMIVIAVFVGVLVIPQLVNAIMTLIRIAPEATKQLLNIPFVRNIIPPDFLAGESSIDWAQIGDSVMNWAKSGLFGSIAQVTSLFGAIGAVFMGFVFGFWFISEKDGLSSRCHRVVRAYVSPAADDFITRTAHIADESFSGYIVGQCTEALIFGTLVAIISFVCGVENPLMLGALVGVMSLIPMVGALIGAILGAFIIMVSSWQQAIIFLVVFFVVQQIEANFLYIRVVGKRVGLTGMWPIVGLTLGGAIFGFAGAFVGVPLISFLNRVLESDLSRRESDPEVTSTPLEKLKDTIKS